MVTPSFKKYKHRPHAPISGPLSKVCCNEATVNLSNPLRKKMRDITISLQLLASSRLPVAFIQRHLARHGKTDRIRLAAARGLNSRALLIQLAHDAADDGIRLEAALDTGAQPALTAIALKAWHIDMGTSAVTRITNNWSLMRIAQSARQDAVRLQAALKLRSPRLLKHLANTTNDIHVRWQIAKALDDPHLLAQVSLFKRTNARLAPLRNEARRALLNHLDALAKKDDPNALRTLFFAQSDLSIKLEALMRMRTDNIDPGVLEALSQCNFEHVSMHNTRHMLAKINAAGWQMVQEAKEMACRHCEGKGTLAYRSITAHQHHLDSEILPCTECKGQGHIRQNIITCVRDGGQPFVFALPIETACHTHMEPK
jgi:integrase